MTPDVVITRFPGLRKNARGWSARCPAHDDRANSLSLAIGDDGRTLVNCFAGCKTKAIVAAAGLRLADLCPGDTPAPRPSERPLSELDQARRGVLQEGRRQLARLEQHREAFLQADLIRESHQFVTAARRVLTMLGGDHPDVWDLLALVADVEREAFRAEAALA